MYRVLLLRILWLIRNLTVPVLSSPTKHNRPYFLLDERPQAMYTYVLCSLAYKYIFYCIKMIRSTLLSFTGLFVYLKNHSRCATRFRPQPRSWHNKSSPSIGFAVCLSVHHGSRQKCPFSRYSRECPLITPYSKLHINGRAMIVKACIGAELSRYLDADPAKWKRRSEG